MNLDSELDKQLQRAKENDTSLSVILVNVDHFKAVNDQFGHQTGDRVLRETADLLKKYIHTNDMVGRWGGEEFLVISPNAEREKALELAESLRRHMEAHHFYEVGQTTASFGVATYKEDDTHETLLSRCDQALYMAKEKGRNQVAVQELLD